MVFRPEEMARPTLEGEERKKVEESLKQNAFSLAGLSAELQPANLEDGAYNENLGVVVFQSEGRAYAVPSSDDVREQLRQVGYFPKGDIGVPPLNDVTKWSLAQQGSLLEWRKMVEKE